MRIVDDIEQQIQKSEFLAILIQAMKSIGESRMTDQYRTVINGLLQKNLPIATYEQDLKVAPIWARKTIWNIAKKIGQWQNGYILASFRPFLPSPPWWRCLICRLTTS